MEWPGELWRRLLFPFRNRQFDRDLEEEMRFHLEMKGRESGSTTARRQFGNATLLREDSRAAWGWSGMERLVQDLRYAARGLRKAPGFTAVVVLTLALGIGVNTAIFGLVNRLLLRPLPLPESDRLVSLYYRTPTYLPGSGSLSYPSYLHYRDHNRVFSGVAAHTTVEMNVAFGDRTEAVRGEMVTANYFSTLGVSPILGRSFLPEEDEAPGRNPVAMLSAELWRRRFDRDPAILGRQVTINGAPFTIVGIVPEGFSSLEIESRGKPQLWTPTMMYPAALPFGATWDWRGAWGSDWLSAVARLRPGVTFTQADADMAQLTEQLKPAWRAAKLNKDRATGFLIPANDARFPPEDRTKVAKYLYMLLGVVALILLIACSNVASLLLARAVKREREIAVRLALGAGRGRLAQQLLTESALIALIGGAAGLGVAVLTTRFLAGFRVFNIGSVDAGVDGRILVFAAGLSLLTGFVFGMFPLRQCAAMRVDAPRAASGAGRTRRVLIVAQVALSVVLLAGAGLFVRTLRNAQATDPTRDPGRVLMLKLNLAARKYDPARGQRFYRELLDRVHAIPGVRSAAYVMIVPYGGMRGGTDLIPFAGASPVQVDVNRISTAYFDTIGLPVVRGRGFDARDREDTTPVVIVNEIMARRFWPVEDPVGKQVELTQPRRVAQIVGIVRDGRFRGYRADVNPCFYVPSEQSFTPVMNLEVRAAGALEGLPAAILREVHALDKDLLVSEPETLQSFRDAGMARERLSAALLSGLGGLGALIAAIGLYGVLAFSVAQRTAEIGIRMALGAGAGNVLRGVLGEALLLVSVGIAGGLIAARALARFVSALLYGVTASDPATYGWTAAILIAAGLAASLAPALRAARVDPTVALRYE